jgi:hypothetical protein
MKKEDIFKEFNKEVDAKSSKLYDILTKTIKPYLNVDKVNTYLFNKLNPTSRYKYPWMYANQTKYKSLNINYVELESYIDIDEKGVWFDPKFIIIEDLTTHKVLFTTFKIKLSGFNIDEEMIFFSSDIPEEYKIIIDSGSMTRLDKLTYYINHFNFDDLKKLKKYIAFDFSIDLDSTDEETLRKIIDNNLGEDEDYVRALYNNIEKIAKLKKLIL